MLGGDIDVARTDDQGRTWVVFRDLATAQAEAVAMRAETARSGAAGDRVVFDTH